MHFSSSASHAGVLDRDFQLDDVPGVLWTPAGRPSTALVLSGHPGGMHKRAPALVARAHRLVTRHGFAVVALDAPGHGARTRSDEDSARVSQLRRARADGQPLGPVVSEYNADLARRAVPEWRGALDALRDVPDLDAALPVGWTGLTMATEIGIRLAAEEARISAAVLGAAFASPDLLAAAARVTAAVRFLLPEDDPEIDRESGLAVFAALRSADKTLQAVPRTHRGVPESEILASEAFLSQRLLGRDPTIIAAT